MNKTQTSCFLILGMHRSGTSALARSLNLTGNVHIANDLVEPLEDNPEGFWEDCGIVDLQDRLLFLLDRTWDSVGAINTEDLSKPEIQTVINDLDSYVGKHYGSVPLSVIKDPRSCLLVPIWKQIFANQNIRPIYIHLFRSPSEVAQSLWKRGRLPEWKSHALWIRHVVSALADADQKDSVLLSYQELLGSPLKAMAKIDGLLPEPCLSSELSKASEFLREDLRHNHRNLEQLDQVGRVLEEYYELLIGDDAPANITDLLQQGKQLATLYEHSYKLEANLLSQTPLKESKVADLADAVIVEQLEDSRKYAFSLSETVKSTEAHAESLAINLAKKDAYITDFANTIEQKDLFITDLKTTLQDKDSYIGQFTATLVKKEEYIESLAENLSHKDEYIESLAENLSHKDEYIGSLIENLEAKKDQLEQASEYNTSLISVKQEHETRLSVLETEKHDLEHQLARELNKPWSKHTKEHLAKLIGRKDFKE